MKILVAITGASGVIIGVRLIEELITIDCSLFGIISNNAFPVIHHEIGNRPSFSDKIQFFQEDDLHAPFNSSSFLLDAMVIAPCSMKTLAAIAAGYSHNLIVRAAENMLRMKSMLILMPRETPLSAAALENMSKLQHQGAIILPPIVGYYHHPQRVEDMTNFFVGKVLDLLKIPHHLYDRWNSES